MPNEMSGTTALTLLVIACYLCGILARRKGKTILHAILMLLGVIGDLAVTVYLIAAIHVLGQFTEPRQYVGALALLYVHSFVAVLLLVGYAGTLRFSAYFLLMYIGWKPNNHVTEFVRIRARHRAWGYFTLITYCVTLILIPSGGPIAWLLKNWLS